MNESAWKWFRERLQGTDRAHAHRTEGEAIAEAERRAVPPDLRREQERLQRSPAASVRLGRFTEGPLRDGDLLVDAADLRTHLLALGATGSGKTFALVGLLADALRGGRLDSALVLDPKGELSELLTDHVLPALAASLPTAEADALLRRVVVIDPFSTSRLPPLNVLVRDPALPLAIQARDVAECFEAATGTDVSARMETILDWLLRLAIDTGTSFLGVRRALQEPAVLEGLVREAKDADTVRYFVLRFAQEPKASKLALLSRLDRFLALPMTQLCLGSRHLLDFDALLANHVTVVSLGNAPAGLQSVTRFFAMVVMTRLVRAIFRRPARARGFASLIVADEWQMVLNPSLAAEFESVLTLARSRGVHLWLANQQLAQLDRHGAALRQVVLGQVPVQLLFRLAGEDAAALRNSLPATGAMRRAHGAAGGAPFLSPAEEREARVAGANRLPNRSGYLVDRRKGWGAVPFRSATLDLPATSTLPAAYVTQARRGAVSFTVAELEAMRAAEDARLDALAAGPARAARMAPPRAPAASTPTRPTAPTSSATATPTGPTTSTPTSSSTSTTTASSPTSSTTTTSAPTASTSAPTSTRAASAPTAPPPPAPPAPKRRAPRRGGRGGGGLPPIR